jgi:PrtD family type I secretion system ABC transporter
MSTEKASPVFGSEILQMLWQCRRHFGFAFGFSIVINLLFLAPAIYMMQIYDRVLSSGNIETLLMLTVILGVALAVQSGLDVIRTKLLIAASVRIDRLIWPRVMAAMFEHCAVGGVGGRSQVVRDADTFRQFVTGTGFLSVLDLPWLPLYVFFIYVIHPLLAGFCLAVILVLVLLAVANHVVLRRPLSRTNNWTVRHYDSIEAVMRSTEAILAMGMDRAMLRHFARERANIVGWQSRASDLASAFAAWIKFVRMTAQSLVLGIGVWLAIDQQITGGAMFATLILFGRALAPVEQIVGSWRQFIAARDAYRRLQALLDAEPAPLSLPAMALPAPCGRLDVERVTFVPPGASGPEAAILKGLSFTVPAGAMVGIIGPSAAGKSTLARVVTGVYRPTGGGVRIDGADLAQWDRAALGGAIGYLPQDVDLFAGSVRQNIARFTDAAPEAVIAAALMAGVHELILRLPQGYDTELAPNGSSLSGGQRQRIGLARALFGGPTLLVLDEPNSNLDNVGEQALLGALAQMKARAATILIITHKPSLLANADALMVLRDGALEAYGPRQEVWSRYLHPSLLAGAPAAAAAEVKAS